MNFLVDTLDMFSSQKVAHMGPHQYVAHSATRNGKSMSGDLLWSQTEEIHKSEKGFANYGEEELIKNAARDILDVIPKRTATIDLGPGTISAFKRKTLPLIKAINSKAYIPVDQSIAFLRDLIKTKHLGADTDVRPIIDDFFSNDFAYFSETALACSFGSTISNLVHPISDREPEHALTEALSALAASTAKGWILIGFDSNQDGQAVKDYYKPHNLFHLNIFDRIAKELPTEGGFDPEAFEYTPIWIAPSGQLAHVVTVKQDMNFSIGGHPIRLHKDQLLHLKNSYKFKARLFEKCTKSAGLSIVQKWSNDSSCLLYLVHKESKIATVSKTAA